MLNIITGPMFSGKSNELLRRLERLHYAKKPFVLVRPSTDTRKDMCRGMQGWKPKSIIVEGHLTLEKIGNPNEKVAIFIDEAQFFNNVYEFCFHYSDTHNITVSMLHATAEGNLWENASRLLTLATDIQFLTAVCVECGEPANCSHFKGDKQDLVVIGDKTYEPLCFKCWKEKLL